MPATIRISFACKCNPIPMFTLNFPFVCRFCYDFCRTMPLICIFPSKQFQYNHRLTEIGLTHFNHRIAIVIVIAIVMHLHFGREFIGQAMFHFCRAYIHHICGHWIVRDMHRQNWDERWKCTFAIHCLINHFVQLITHTLAICNNPWLPNSHTNGIGQCISLQIHFSLGISFWNNKLHCIHWMIQSRDVYNDIEIYSIRRDALSIWNIDSKLMMNENNWNYSMRWLF